MIRRLKRAAKRNARRPYRWRWTGVANPTLSDVLKAVYMPRDGAIARMAALLTPFISKPNAPGKYPERWVQV